MPNTLDPSTRSAKPKDPKSWNRYSYVGGDPITYRDPRGLEQEDCSEAWISDAFISGPCCLPGAYWSDVTDEAACYASYGGSGGDGQDNDTGPSCNIKVATSGGPIDGQNLQSLTNYSPTTNKLGAYSNTIGWFFAVQIQGSLHGDTNPEDWSATQTKSSSGSVSIAGRPDPIVGSTPTTPDNPDFGIFTSTNGRFDWLDEPGWPKTQFGSSVTAATLTQDFTSTLTNKATGVKCSVSWSLQFTLQNDQWKFVFKQK